MSERDLRLIKAQLDAHDLKFCCAYLSKAGDIRVTGKGKDGHKEVFSIRWMQNKETKELYPILVEVKK